MLIINLFKLACLFLHDQEMYIGLIMIQSILGLKFELMSCLTNIKANFRAIVIEYSILAIQSPII